MNANPVMSPPTFSINFPEPIILIKPFPQIYILATHGAKRLMFWTYRYITNQAFFYLNHSNTLVLSFLRFNSKFPTGDQPTISVFTGSSINWSWSTEIINPRSAFLRGAKSIFTIPPKPLSLNCLGNSDMANLLVSKAAFFPILLPEFKSTEIFKPLFDDLNTPGLIAELNKIAKEYNSDDEANKKIIKSKLSLIGSVLGIFQDQSFNEISDDLKNKVEDLISKRNDAKIEKNFDLADLFRDELAELGIEIKDTSDGTSWNVKS